MFKKKLKEIYASRSILWDMSGKRLKEKYAGSKLGIWWALIIPLALTLSINFVFTAVFNINIKNYAFLLLSGMLPWFFFSESVIESVNSFAASSSLLKQAIFPREFVPASCVISNFMNFLIGFVFLIPLFILLNHRVFFLLPALTLVLIANLIFVAGVAVIFSIINTFARDTLHILPVMLMTWFWITPVFYSLEMVPMAFRWVCLINPVTYYVKSYQDILFYARLPAFSDLSACFLIGLSALAIGHAIFMKKEPSLMKRI